MLSTMVPLNKLVNAGMPFRDAYKKVGLDIEAGNFTYSTHIEHTHEGSIGNLCTAQIQAQMKLVVDGMEVEKVNERIQELLNI